jgi:hypothetical protein
MRLVEIAKNRFVNPDHVEEVCYHRDGHGNEIGVYVHFNKPMSQFDDGFDHVVDQCYIKSEYDLKETVYMLTVG